MEKVNRAARTGDKDAQKLQAILNSIKEGLEQAHVVVFSKENYSVGEFVDVKIEDCTSRTHFNYQKKDLACKYFWEDGKRLNAYSDQEKYLEEVEQQLGVTPKVLKAYLAKAKKKYDLTVDLFLEKSLHKSLTL